MVVISSSEVLMAWEAAADRSPTGRALYLAAAAAGRVEGEIAELPIGARDAILLRLHEALFGQALIGVVSCPTCGTEVEFECDTGVLHAAVVSETSEAQRKRSIAFDSFDIQLRSPTSIDL